MGILDRLFGSSFAPGERTIVAEYLFAAWDLRARQDLTDPKAQAANAVALRPISPAAMDHYHAWCLVYDAAALISDKAADLLVKSTPAEAEEFSQEQLAALETSGLMALAVKEEERLLKRCSISLEEAQALIEVRRVLEKEKHIAGLGP